MTKIKFKDKIYKSIDEVMKENHYDTYSIRIYRENFNLSSYEILKKIDNGSIDEIKFIDKETTVSGLKRKEIIAYLVLKSSKPFIVNGVTYVDIEQAIRKEKINYKILFNKFIHKNNQNPDTLIQIFSDLVQSTQEQKQPN